MFSKMHLESNPFGSDLRKHMIYRGTKGYTVLGRVSIAALHRYQSCAGVGDKDLVFLVESY
jgi:hypothetical protein